MPKKTFQDISPNKKTIRNISMPKKQVVKFAESVEKLNKKTKSSRSKRKTKKVIKKILFITVISLIIIFAGILWFLSGTYIDLVPRQQTAVFDARFTATVNDESLSVPYDVLVFRENGSEVVKVTGEELLERKASGKIIIYNNYNTQSQRLIKNTRFETPDGLIYRIRSSVIVPGMADNIPGSIEVIIYADSTGEVYNIGLTDFTIPGFKGTPRFSKFYARSKTSVKGGFSGIIKTVTKEDEQKALDKIEVDLRDKLLSKVQANVPSNYVSYSDGIFMEFDILDNVDFNDTVEIRGEMSVYAIVFEKNKLSKHIIRSIFAEDQEEEIEVINLSNLNFSIQNKNTLDPKSLDRLIFSLNGEVNMVWIFNESQLKQDLVGRSKKDVNNILSGYTGIKEAKIVVRPFWRKKFPNSVDKIEIRTSLDK